MQTTSSVSAVRLRASLVLAALLLAGCGGSSSTTAPPAPLSVSARTPEGLTATLTQNSATVPVNGTLQYTMTLKNDTSVPVSYQGEAYDGDNVQTRFAQLTVYSADGSQFYPGGTPSNPPPPSHAVTITLQPGEAQTETQAIPATYFPAAPYHAVATFRTSGVVTATPSLLVKVQ